MRALLLIASLVAVTLAGCASEPVDNVVDDTIPDLSSYVAGPGSHPSAGLPVTEDLPIAGEEELADWPAYWYQPSGTPLPEAITSLVPGAHVTEVGSGAGIAVFGSLAFVGAYDTAKIWAVDISNLDEPQVIGFVDASSAGDLDTIAFPPSEEHPDGMLVLVAATRGKNVNAIDATDPTNMTLLGTFEPAGGNHNLQVLPGTALVYNAQSGGEGNPTAIWDLSDPTNPAHVEDFQNGYGCHAVDFYVNTTTEKYYGFCAGIEVTQVWDVSNATNPTVLSTAPWPVAGQDVGTSGAVSPATFSHLATANHDGNVMIVGDETGGGLAPGCDFSVHDPVTGTTVSGPLGNLYFYDITDPANPVLHGSVSPNAYDQRGSCTAHFGGVIEDRNQLVMAFYSVGTALIDFNDIDNPYVQDLGGRDETDTPCTLCGTWDSQYYRGHVITGDVDRGMDVLSFA